MAIYSRFGDEVELLNYCGKHQVKGFPAPMMLVEVAFKDDGAEMYLLAHTLKADGGPREIDDAIDKLPEVKLPEHRLKRALEMICH